MTQRRAHTLTHAHTVTLCLLRTHASTHKNAQATLSRSLTHSLVQRFHLLESKALQILSTLTQLSVPDSTIDSEPRPPENSEFSLPLHSHVTPASPLASHRRGLDRSRYRRTRPFTSSHLRWHHPPTAPTSFRSRPRERFWSLCHVLYYIVTSSTAGDFQSWADLISFPRSHVFLLIYPCAAGCDRTRLSFHFTKGPGQIAPRC